MVAKRSEIQVQGLSEVVRDLTRFGIDLEDLREAFRKIAAEALPTYRGYTPSRSGRLRSNYRTGRTKNRAVLYVGGAAVPYAPAINYGWGSSSTSWQHGRRASGKLRGTYPGAEFVAKGDRIEAPRALTTIQNDIDRLIQQRNLT